jgi:hypothetical protein
MVGRRGPTLYSARLLPRGVASWVESLRAGHRCGGSLGTRSASVAENSVMVMDGWVGASGAAFGLTSPKQWELEVKFAAMSAGPRIKLSVLT